METLNSIKLTQGKLAIIDAEDYEKLSRVKWQFNNGYAVKSVRVGKKFKTLMMHREILNAPEGLEIDHKNGNRLDNRKSNLRFCTRSENICNISALPNKSSPYKGVTWHKVSKKWQARVKKNGKSYFLGLFHNECDAAQAYVEKAKELHYEFFRS